MQPGLRHFQNIETKYSALRILMATLLCFALTSTPHSSNWACAKTQVLQIARAGDILVKSIDVIPSRNTTQYFPAFLMRPWLDIRGKGE